MSQFVLLEEAMKMIPDALPKPHTVALTNPQIAAALKETANLLEAQGANPFRVQAYRRAVDTLQKLKFPVRRLLDCKGTMGLVQVPTIGRSIATAIGHLAHSGHFPMLDRLRGEATVEKAFATVPDIGKKLAHRIHDHLEIETLAELQAAANDGRLGKVPGMGEKRIRAVRESLAGRFHQSAYTTNDDSQPIDVAELLSIDAQYRRLAERDALPKIRPSRFNPSNEAWLPILHAHREERHYTALYSNTERAHRLGTLKDWVVIYRDDQDENGRWTVITALYGRLRGHRIVTGHDAECRAHYRNTQ